MAILNRRTMKVIIFLALVALVYLLVSADAKSSTESQAKGLTIIKSVFLNIASRDKEIGRIESTSGYKGNTAQHIFKDVIIRGGVFPHGDDTGGKTATNLTMTTSQLSHYGSGLPSTTSAGRDVNGSQFFITTTTTGHDDR
ncbi:peptidyl-prolyl cis-trans isomerase B-like [Diadema antillarum]|uniref:peptidyl-prolyl cis-trans isomerase B-like n=1 Tax=Diadema antillarum TaxID=105358 RepID=UPI003A8834A7